ncbi:MAG: proteasome subunit beta [Acidimicrobiaceae bacterium]|nr:proteasome subunit beta [Acidimicrobiaceae bacterium]MBT5567918.1 proteasome subunit beta [Acidimicrobiaceae bacterium]
MTLPTFAPGDDPGPDFVGLLTRLGVGSFESTVVFDPAQITHGTTVLAIRYSDGVLMAGDRRATSGHLISHRSIEKVFPADSSSGVAIAGAAGPAIEMVRLFQLQLEHYEKVEGTTLTLDGKANQLSQMLRNHLPAAMQGLAVVPLFAGFDSRTEQGRLFQFDVTGGRYEERDYAAIGSGGLHAATVMKLRHQPGIGADEAIDVAIEAMFQAADEDIATGGPDTVRGIYPVVALITADGFERLADDDVAARTGTLLESLGGAS